ncbi:MAG: DUF3786 domain-containing protein [Lachnospiraceae bacterium]
MRNSYIADPDSRNPDRYQKVCDDWRLKFLEMDHQKLVDFFGLDQDDQAIYITYYNIVYRVDKTTGMIWRRDDPERRLEFDTIIAIYNLFHYYKDSAQVRGVFVPYRQVRRAAPFAPAFEKSVMNTLAAGFSGHLDQFIKASEKLGGRRDKEGDASFVYDAFSCMPVKAVFWDGDDEFPAQAQVLFDADITEYLHEETVVCIGGGLISRLFEEADLPEEQTRMTRSKLI